MGHRLCDLHGHVERTYVYEKRFIFKIFLRNPTKLCLLEEYGK